MSTDPAPADPVPAVEVLVVDDDPVVRFGLTIRLIDRVAATDRDTTRDTARRRLTLLAGRERTVAPELGAGRSSAEIAARHHLGIATVKTHVSAVLTGLDLNNRVQVALLVRDADLDRPQ